MSFSEMQFSVTLPVGGRDSYHLSVLAKRRYRITDEGNCVRDVSGDKFELDTKFYGEKTELMAADYELYPYKPLSDIVVKATVKGDGKSRLLTASIQTGGFVKTSIAVLGKRNAYKTADGHIQFTDPAIIEEVPLRYDFAYGGADHVAEQKLNPVPDNFKNALPDVNWDYASEFRYPRNPCGKGYVVENSREIFENLELPQLEDPLQLLNKENLVLGHAYNWLNQPMPKATDWVNMAWFPRIAYWGILPLYDKKMLKANLPELALGLAEPDVLHEKPIELKLNKRASNGASLGLQLPWLNGSESFRLTNMHAQKRDFVLQLPQDKPRIWIDGRNGKLVETRPVLQTVIIDFNEGYVTTIWQGMGPALRPYMDEELDKMPFKVEWQYR